MTLRILNVGVLLLPTLPLREQDKVRPLQAHPPIHPNDINKVGPLRCIPFSPLHHYVPLASFCFFHAFPISFSDALPGCPPHPSYFFSTPILPFTSFDSHTLAPRASL